MTETIVRIEMYFKQYKKVPESLDVLPKRSGYANSTIDGWGRALRYSIDDDGILKLCSLGANGALGGAGADADIVWSFRTLDVTGSSIILRDDWSRISKLTSGK